MKYDDDLRVTISLTVTPYLAQWIKNKSKEMNMTRSALLALCVTQYIDYTEGMKAIRQGDFMDKLNDIYKVLIDKGVR